VRGGERRGKRSGRLRFIYQRCKGDEGEVGKIGTDNVKWVIDFFL